MPTEKEVVRQSLDALADSQVDWAILHCADRLPEHGESDIDIVVRTADLSRVKVVLGDVASALGGRLIQVIEHESTAVYHVLELPADSGRVFVKIDACGDYRRDGVVLFVADELLASCRTVDGLPAVSHETEFGYYLVKRILKDRWDDDSLIRLKSMYKNDPVGTKRVLYDLVGGNAPLLAAALDSDQEDEALRDAGRSARSGVLRRAWMRHPVGCLLYHPRNVRRMVARLLRPTGLHVAILGPDGVGKTTIIELLSKTIHEGFRRVSLNHLRPKLIPSRGGSDSPVTPYRRPVYRGVLAHLKLAYLWLDYTLGFWARILPAKASSTLVVYDRYLADLIVDPARYRYGGSPRAVRLAATLAPSPDLYLILDADTESIQTRKSEVTPMRTQELREAYCALPSVLRASRVVILDANKEPGDVAEDAAEQVLGLMASRVDSWIR